MAYPHTHSFDKSVEMSSNDGHVFSIVMYLVEFAGMVESVFVPRYTSVCWDPDCAWRTNEPSNKGHTFGMPNAVIGKVMKCRN